MDETTASIAVGDLIVGRCIAENMSMAGTVTELMAGDRYGITALGSGQPTTVDMPTRLVLVDCANPGHDHTTPQTPDGYDLAEPIPMLCNHCGLPTHYDKSVEDYRHDDPDADPCFLVPNLDDGTPCVLHPTN